MGIRQRINRVEDRLRQSQIRGNLPEMILAVRTALKQSDEMELAKYPEQVVKILRERESSKHQVTNGNQR